MFEEFLLFYQPVIGIVERAIHYEYILKVRPKNSKIPSALFTGMLFDPMCNGFHYKAIDNLLPYDESFDKVSWHRSLQILQCKVIFKYHAQVVTFTDLLAINKQHSKYPIGMTPLVNVCPKEMKQAPQYMKDSQLAKLIMGRENYDVAFFSYIAPANHSIKPYGYFVNDFCVGQCFF